MFVVLFMLCYVLMLCLWALYIILYYIILYHYIIIMDRRCLGIPPYAFVVRMAAAVALLCGAWAPIRPLDF